MIEMGEEHGEGQCHGGQAGRHGEDTGRPDLPRLLAAPAACAYAEAACAPATSAYACAPAENGVAAMASSAATGPP